MFACIFLCICTSCMSSTREHRILWNWSYGWLRSTTWVVGSWPRSSTRAASAHNCWAISVALNTDFSNFIYCICVWKAQFNWVEFSPFTYLFIPRFELRLSGLHIKCFDPPCLTSTRSVFFCDGGFEAESDVIQVGWELAEARMTLNSWSSCLEDKPVCHLI